VIQPLLSRGKGELAQSARLRENPLCVLGPFSGNLIDAAAPQRPIFTVTLHGIVTVIVVVFPGAIAIARPAAGVPSASDPRVGTCLVPRQVPFVPLVPVLPVPLPVLPVLLSALSLLVLLPALPVLLPLQLPALHYCNLLGECLALLPALPVLLPALPLLPARALAQETLPVLLPVLLRALAQETLRRIHALLQENSPYWKDIAVGHGSSLKENDKWKSRWRII